LPNLTNHLKIESIPAGGTKTLKYRKFGKLDFEVSILGFGAMRLPFTDNNPANVVESESITMVRYAIDHGVNYLDSAYMYHNGRSEVIIGRALQDGYREKVKIATKLPCILIQTADEFERIFNEQLKRLQTDKIDFYLLHGLNNMMWAKMQEMKVLQWAEGKMAAGLIGHLGFSFHDRFEVFKEIVDAYDGWTFCQIQYNYMDVKHQAGTQGLKYAADKGLAVVIMEPMRGGRLSKEPPREVADLWASAATKRTPTEWALLWLWEHPEISVVLSGMSSMQQVTENLAVADRCGPGVLSQEELALVDKVREAYRKLTPVPCTGCGYCLPCPNGVEIPRIFEIYNDGTIYDDPILSRFYYSGRFGLKTEQRADKCIICEQCIEKCPQNVPIPEWLKKAHEFLSPKT
jgi:predicted aldo/keto reductase-like oxidoreductase